MIDDVKDPAAGWKGKLALFLISCLLSLVLLEAFTRVYLFGVSGLSPKMIRSVGGLVSVGFVQASTSSEIVYELPPNKGVYHKLVWVETNSRGLRDEEYTLERRPDSVRVAVVGDSYTMPGGVKIDDAYHTVLEEMLNEHDSRRRYELINFGVAGYSLRQYIAVIKEKALRYSPDLILIGFCAENDYEVPPSIIFERPYTVRQRPDRFYSLFAPRLWDVAKRNLRLLLEQGDEASIQRPTLTEQQRAYVRASFDELDAIRLDTGVPVVIAYLANRPRASGEIESLIAGTDLHFVDISLAFSGTQLKDYRINPIDSHPNAAAHKVFAERLLPVVSDLVTQSGLADRRSRPPAWMGPAGTL